MIRDTERDRSKQSTARRICPPPLSSLPSHQTHIDKLELLRMGYYITTRLATRWWKKTEIMDGIHRGGKRYMGRGEKIMWTALFFLLGFDEVVHDLGYGKGQIEKGQRYITSLFTRKITGKHTRQPQFYLVHTAIYLHWKARTSRGCCDTNETQRRKTFGNRLTGPQLGAKNSKPWRNSVTSPKARHLKPLFLQPEQMERRSGK